MSANKVDIVIVNWNSGLRLQACLDSIERSALRMAEIASVCVVDNGSNDNSLPQCDAEGRFPRLTVRNSENFGFGRACNQGARLSSSELLLFVNPDVVLEESTIERAVAVMRDPENAQVAVCGIRLVDEAGHASRTCARFPTSWSMCVYALGLNRLFPRLMPAYVMSEWNHEDSRPVAHVIGAFYLVRRSEFEAVGGFDERYFVYFEDLDLSRKIAQRGLTAIYRADIRAYHEGGGSSKQIRGRRLFYSVDSRLKYSWKHFGTMGAISVAALSLLVEPVIRILGVAARRDFASVKHTLVGYGMLYSSLVASGVNSWSSRSGSPAGGRATTERDD